MSAPGSSPRYTVRVTKDHLVFSAGHFITFDGDHCERIHGHNYRVAVELEGPLDENSYVFDFLALLEAARGIVSEWDHRMLLPASNPHIRLEDDGPGHVRARYRDRHWCFPSEECVILPIANTTTELLARVFAERLLERLEGRGAKVPRPGSLRVEVEENFGQWARLDWPLEGDGDGDGERSA